MIQYKLFERSSSAHYMAASSVWNAASTAEFTISPTFIGYNTQVFTGVTQEGRLAFDGRRPVGFAMVSHADGVPEVVPPEKGFIELMAVHPDYQRRDIGSQLLEWGENWLRKRGVHEVQLGGGLAPFAPGLPDEVNAQGFFQQRGYQPRAGTPYVWDVARNLTATTTPPVVAPEPREGGQVRPARPHDQQDLEDFLAREFPGRWKYEFDEYTRLGGRISDILLLLIENEIQGFVWTTLEDSARLLERFHPGRMLEPWGQAGPLGVAKHLRGEGWGRFMMQSMLQHMRKSNVRGMVIDWTDKLEFYGKFGFTPYRRYLMMSKKLTSETA